MTYPVVDPEPCNGCAECVAACPMAVYEMNAGKSVVAVPEDCTGCGACVPVCLPNAIDLVDGPVPARPA